MNDLAERPFALIGVNCWNDDPVKLRKVMIREQLNWRSFVAQGAIAKAWNNPPTPTFYVLDARGVIRRKWVGSPGAKTVDAVVEKLVQEAEETRSPQLE